MNGSCHFPCLQLTQTFEESHMLIILVFCLTEGSREGCLFLKGGLLNRLDLSIFFKSFG